MTISDILYHLTEIAQRFGDLPVEIDNGSINDIALLRPISAKPYVKISHKNIVTEESELSPKRQAKRSK